MTSNEHAPKFLRLVHGMEHAGLSMDALAIERSREFKEAFVTTITEELGFAAAAPDLTGGAESGGGLAAFLETFGPDGHPPETETAGFVTAQLASRAGPEFAAADAVLDLCVFVPPADWRVIGGYTVTKDGQPWTVEAAVAEYERRNGKIKDPAVRAELAAIPVHVQIEWEIRL